MRAFGFAAIAVGAVASASAFGQTCPSGVLPLASNITANGPAYTSTMWDPDADGPRQPLLVVGGGFDHVANGAVAGSIAAFDLATRRWTNDLSGSTALVRVLLATRDGDLYAAGDFVDALGGPPAFIARWTGTEWSAMDQGPDGIVLALTEAPNGDLIAGGMFENAGGAPALKVARWNGSQWSAMGDGLNGPVRALAITSNGQLYAGGEFDRSGTERVGHLATWNGTVWQPTTVPVGDGDVRALAAMPDGSLAVGGAFSTINGASYPRIARLSNGQWSQMGFFLGPVDSLKLEADGFLYAVGMYAPSNPAARWNGTAWQPIQSSGNSVTFAAPLSESEIILSGNLYVPNDPYSYIVVVHAPFGGPSPTNGTIFNAVRDGRGGCIVSGSFTTIAGVPANRIARWDGVRFTPLGDGLPAAPSSVYVLRNGDVLASGSSSIFSGGIGHLARWNGSTWNFTSFPVNQWIKAITELPNGDIVVAGSIYTVTPGGIDHVARVNANSLEPIGEGVEGIPSVLRTGFDGQPIVGGDITNSIMQWTGTYWRSLAEGLQRTPIGAFSLTDLEVLSNGDLLAVGSFNNAGGAPIESLARWNGADWFAVAPSSFTSALTQLELHPSGALIGLTARSNNQSGAVRTWDGSQTRTLFRDPAYTGASISGILELNGELIAYGSFDRIGQSPVKGFARYAFSNTPWTAIHPEPVITQEGSTVVLTATPATGYESVRVRWQRNGVFINDGPAGAAPGGGEVSGANALMEPLTNGTPAMLVIFDAQYVDGGQYTAVFSTDCGSNTSRAADVTVNPLCPPCPGDYDNDGGVTGADLGAFFNDYEKGLTCADVDHDGGITGADLAVFFAVFEAGGC